MDPHLKEGIELKLKGIYTYANEQIRHMRMISKRIWWATGMDIC